MTTVAQHESKPASPAQQTRDADSVGAPGDVAQNGEGAGKTAASTLPADSETISGWERASFGVVHGALSALLAVVGLRGLYRIGRAFGTLEWIINFKRRRRFGRALHEVLHPLSGRDRRRHTREHFMQTRCDKLFYLIFDRIPRDVAIASLTLDNGKALDDALALGRGAYVALCHHGPLHISGMLMTIRGYKVAGVRDRREGALRRYVQGLYDRKYPEFGRARILYADSFPREIFRCLQDGYALGSAMDISRVRDPKQKSQEVMMFGKPQVFLTGPLRIALRCKSPILQAFILPGRDFQYRLSFVGDLLDAGESGSFDEEAAITRAIETYASRVESHIRSHPSQMTRT